MKADGCRKPNLPCAEKCEDCTFNPAQWFAPECENFVMEDDCEGCPFGFGCILDGEICGRARCEWCGRDLGPRIDLEAGKITGGICPACIEKVRQKEILLIEKKEEHDPEKCGCKYIGMDMWSCGHCDNDQMGEE